MMAIVIWEPISFLIHSWKYNINQFYKKYIYVYVSAWITFHFYLKSKNCPWWIRNIIYNGDENNADDDNDNHADDNDEDRNDDDDNRAERWVQMVEKGRSNICFHPWVISLHSIGRAHIWKRISFDENHDEDDAARLLIKRPYQSLQITTTWSMQLSLRAT